MSERAPTAKELYERACAAGDVIEQARQTLIMCMQGSAGDGLQARTRYLSATAILGTKLIESWPDDVLLREIERRRKLAQAKQPVARAGQA